MGVSDDERRNVAETMRSMLVGNDIRYAEQFYDLLTGDVLPDYQTRSYRQTIEVLADLIDRPTCRNAYDGREFDCSACGATWHLLEQRDGGEWSHVRTPGFCPKCGAEVMSDEG